MPLGAARLALFSKPQITAVAEVIRRKVGITAVGNAQVDTAQSQFGGASAVFDGLTDTYIATDNTSQGLSYSDDFTFEGWVRFNSLPSVFAMLATGSTRGDYVAIRNNSGTYTLQAAYSNGSTVYYHDYQLGSTPSTGVWYHFAIVKEGSTVKHFWNGTELTVNFSSSGTMTADKGWNGVRRIGDWAGGTNYALNGWLDEIRFSNTARYTANFTPSTTPFVNDANTLLLLHMDGTDGSTFFEDDNGVRNKVGITAVGNAQVDTAQSKFGGASALFDGSGDYLQFDTDILNSLPGNDYTIELWARFDNTGTFRTLVANQGTNGAVFLQRDSSNKISLFYIGDSAVLETTSTVTSNTWYHIALVNDNGTQKLFLDGTLEASRTETSYTSTTSPGMIGRRQSVTSRDMDGYIDEVRISNTARYTANFTPPTAPFVNDENTLLLLHMDGPDASTIFRDDNAIDDRLQGYSDSYADFLELAVPFDNDSSVGDIAYLINDNLTAAASNTQGASSTISNTNSYFYSHSLENDRSGSALTYALPNGIPSSATGTFVVEGWFRAGDSGTNSNWALSSGDSGGRWLFGVNNGTVFTFANENKIGIGSGWHHLAIVCDGGVKRFYYDGIYKGAWVSSNTGFSTLHVGEFKSGDANDFIGNIQDLRVTVGSNRGYTGTNTGSANFTLPNKLFVER